MSVWYYEHDGAQEGPVDADTLQRLVDEGVVARETLVWRDGMADWAPAASVRGLLGGPPPVGGWSAGESAATGAPLMPEYGATPGHAGLGGQGHVDNHLVKAILATLFCCMPLGIVSIVYASGVNGKLQMGFYDDAVASAQKADQWANYSIFAGLAAIGLYVVMMVLGVGLGM